MHARKRSRGRDHENARIALVAGLAVVAIAVCLTLTRHPVSVAASNGTPRAHVVVMLPGGATICQGGESIPRDTDAVRLSLFTSAGPSVRLRVLSGSRILTEGARGRGWTAGEVTIPVARPPAALSGATICATLGQTIRSVSVLGQAAAPAVAASSLGQRLLGRMTVEYLRPGRATWWSSIRSVARRMGLGHALAGTWIVLFLAALMAVASIVACRLVLASSTGELGAIPKAAWTCALVACVNAICWSSITPPFQAPDEPDHYAYVERLAETASLPPSGTEHAYSPQETRVLEDLDYRAVRQEPQTPTIATAAQQGQLERDLAEPLSQTGQEVGVAASEPPLYYALEAIPYRLSANVLDRLALMRLLSALFAGLTAMLVVLFLREALPGVPWAWTVGGLGVALAPLLGFVSGAVNPDAMLASVSSALFYCLARGLRRGLTSRLAIAIGAIMAVGLLTKLNFIGLLPGALLGLVVLSVRAARTDRARAARSLLLAVAVPSVPAIVYILANVLSGDPTLGLLSRATSDLARGSALHEVAYIWQFYLPRLPGMDDYFPGILTTRELWFDRGVGLYGWLDTVFPGWVDDLAIVPAALIGGLCVRALLASRPSFRARAAELAVYGAMLAGELALVGADSYIQSSQPQGELFAEPRYLLPLIALWGAVLALAARGAGRRWLPVAGSLIVVAILAHDIFSQLQVIARYYG
jgi:hypothetical protein